MGRLIVISNRVSPPSDVGGGTQGGLAMALAAALREHSGIWFGWSGQTTETYSGQVGVQRAGGVTVATMDLEDQDVQEYYNGYANKTLWPLFHHRVDLTAYERSFGEGYARVNARFAETVLPLIEEEDFVWIHDYHLIPLAQELRRRGVKNRIGFFLHIPWPARHLITTLPRHPQLVEALFDYDLVGFQTQDSLEAFKDYVVHEVGGSLGEGRTLSAFGRTAEFDAFPIGMDVAEFTAALDGETAKREYARMQTSMLDRQMIIGVDRLDYSKGLEERFLAYEQFLQDNPDLHEKVFLLQIATPSREDVEAYQEIRGRLDGVSGRINGAFSTVDWVPIRYVNRGYRRDQLAGIYRAAKLGLVTPLRDGMNLVAKEYVAAQDPEDPGVLILSRFAGAAEQMGEALIVNPFSREDVSDAILRGLAMPLAERRRRWDRLMADLRTTDVSAWRDDFVRALMSN
ncbi:alpha,alpha-trehalose-phosphate synthase (UDP-forming) [Phenylobacterium sp.]|jgi:trehalose 6-phosphate synthase|uniref:alpha,alpha-trehalose-phosphate synthase (UDP-forming) n=1 Tax=Phenylobacterium sp. TaxID=1871053 RepID=UPI000C925896|nr:alpha,alpha-trehalose-phosphate synthase (UDP-forming) [Phenylobacterium sp.]MAK82763.1 alpha,alpha-trehalose-phosphate synthase (UDP-forming) [Phenylobacterium sp.]|tara:strand:+ start:10829 stop:12202 length:1374 start_codon:yes stop_codon:yes gene_type:complete